MKLDTEFLFCVFKQLTNYLQCTEFILYIVINWLAVWTLHSYWLVFVICVQEVKNRQTRMKQEAHPRVKQRMRRFTCCHGNERVYGQRRSPLPSLSLSPLSPCHPCPTKSPPIHSSYTCPLENRYPVFCSDTHIYISCASNIKCSFCVM